MNVHNIIKVYKRDWKSIIINPIACILVVGMCAIPSLYAWVNIKACWNTYENTSTIPVAVVNNDKQANLNGKNINIGQDVIKKLKTNHKIGWVFVNSRQANLGLVDGTYYAMIEIPEDFSSDFLSVLSDKTKKPQIIYKVDTKANPVAGKITEAAKNTLVDQITSNFVSTVNETVFSSLNDIGKNVGENKENIIKLKDSIIAINNNMDAITNALQGVNSNSGNFSMFLSDIKATMPAVESAMDNIGKNNSDNASIIKSTQNTLNTSLNNIDINLSCAKASNDRISSLFNSLNNSVSTANSSENNSIIPKINTEIDSLNSSISSTIDYLQQCNSIDYTSDIAKAITLLKNLQTSLSDLKQELLPVQIQLNYTFSTLDEIYSYLKEKIPQIDDQIDSLNQTISKVISTLQECNEMVNSSDITQLTNSLSTMQSSLTDFKTSLNAIKDNIVSLKNDITNTKSQIDALDNQINSAINSLQSVSNNNANTELLKNIQSSLSDVKSQFTSIQQQLDSVTDIDKLEAQVSNIDTKIDNLNQLISLAISGLKEFSSSGFTPLINSLSTIQSTLTSLKIPLNDVTNQLRQLKYMVALASNDLANISDKIDTINNQIDSAINFLQLASVTCTNNRAEVSNIIASLKNIQSNLSDEKSQFSSIQQQLNGANGIGKSEADSINNDISGINERIESVSKKYNSGVKDNLNAINNNLITSTEDASALINSAKDLNSQIDKLINTSIDGNNLASKFSSDLNSKLLQYKGVISLLGSKLQLVNNNDIIQIVSILQSNPKAMGDFISNPFTISDESINEIPNYGSGMAPIYTILALWVGCLIINALFKTDVGYFEGIEKLTLKEKHFGKMMIYSTLAVIQGFIISVGDILIVHVYTVNAPLMIAFVLVSSLTFSIITYTLSSTLGNVGKAVSIIYMIFQIAGCGGSYPIQIDPKILRILQPLFPFTYAVGGVREAIAGPLISSVVLDFVALFLFAFVALLCGFFFKEPLYKRVHKFEVKFKESGVGE